MQGMEAQTWLLAAWTGFQLNLMLVVLGLLGYIAEGDSGSEGLWAALLGGASWVFCALYLLHHCSRWHATPLPEFSRRGPRHGPAAYCAFTVLFMVCSTMPPGALQSQFSAANRFLFSAANLCTVQAAISNLAISLSRIAGCYHHGGPDAHEAIIGAIVKESCTLLCVVSVTYLFEEACKSLTATRGLGFGAPTKASGVHPTLPDAFSMLPTKEILPPTRTIGNKSASPQPASALLESEILGLIQALSSVAMAKCDALVFVNATLRVTSPAPKLARLLGYQDIECGATSMLDMALPLQPLSQEFTQDLDRLEPSVGGQAAKQLPISLITAPGGSVTVMCAYAGYGLGPDGCRPKGYILGMSAMPSPQEGGSRGAPGAQKSPHMDASASTSGNHSRSPRPLSPTSSASVAMSASSKYRRPDTRWRSKSPRHTAPPRSPVAPPWRSKSPRSSFIPPPSLGVTGQLPASCSPLTGPALTSAPNSPRSVRRRNTYSLHVMDRGSINASQYSQVRSCTDVSQLGSRRSSLPLSLTTAEDGRRSTLQSLSSSPRPRIRDSSLFLRKPVTLDEILTAAGDAMGILSETDPGDEP